MKDYGERVLNIMDNAKDNIMPQIDKVYKSGYEDAKAELGKSVINLAHEESDRAYQQGLDDAWEAVRKITEIPISERKFVFDLSPEFDLSLFSLLRRLSIQEVISKIKEYEEQQKKFAVGDEVYSDAFDDKGIITHITADKVSCVCIICNGSTMMKVGTNDLHKTGRHFDQIAEVLEKIRGE